MPGPAKQAEKSPEPSQKREPAKGGMTPAQQDTHPSGDTSKPHGDPLRHVIEDQKKKQ
jgi:hypothetical protein